MKIEIKSWLTKEVIWSHECENNSMRLTVEAAVRAGASLRYAELNGARLNGAELNGAKLNYAKLNGAKLNGAELNGAELNGAELNGAELNYAKLNYAKLNGAELNYAKLNYAELNYAVGNATGIHCYQHGKYKLVVHGDTCHAGCTTKSLQEWLDYSGDELDVDAKQYLETITKPFIRMVLAQRGVSE